MKRNETRKKAIWMLKNWQLYALLVLPLIWILVFCYEPMYGLLIAFQNYKPKLGIMKSPWIGLSYFKTFVNAYVFKDVVWNTIAINLYGLLLGFPAPILFALLINEVQSKVFKKTVQTVSYLPTFITTVVFVSMINVFCNESYGFIYKFLSLFGGKNYTILMDPDKFRMLYTLSGIWQGCGWNSIIYSAALTNVDKSLHEAAEIDGANRLQIITHINIPTILPTIITLFIFAVGGMMNVGYDKIYLMQGFENIKVSEVISTYVYKQGLQGAQYSYATAIGLFNNVINFALLLITDRIALSATGVGVFYREDK